MLALLEKSFAPKKLLMCLDQARASAHGSIVWEAGCAGGLGVMSLLGCDF